MNSDLHPNLNHTLTQIIMLQNGGAQGTKNSYVVAPNSVHLCRVIASAAAVHGARGFDTAAPAGDPVFGGAGGGIAAVAALTCALIAAGGVREDGDWIRDATDLLLQVSIAPPCGAHNVIYHDWNSCRDRV